MMQLPRKMSANVMASIGRKLGNRQDVNAKHSNDVKLAGEESKDKLYESKDRQKVIRVLTVVAYVISVSLAAIILSLYYTFIWDPKDRPLYAMRQNPLGSTTKIECINLTVPVIADFTKKTNDSHISRLPLVERLANDTMDQGKSNETNFLSERFVAEVPPDLAENSSEPMKSSLESTMESALVGSSPLIIQPEFPLSDEGIERSTVKRSTQDTSDFDFV